MVQRLLKVNGINVKVTYNDWTPLHSAAHNGHTEVVQLLIDNGADVNQPNKYGETPLFLAEEDGHPEVADLLRKHGATK